MDSRLRYITKWGLSHGTKPIGNMVDENEKYRFETLLTFGASHGQKFESERGNKITINSLERVTNLNNDIETLIYDTDGYWSYGVSGTEAKMLDIWDLDREFGDLDEDLVDMILDATVEAIKKRS